MNLYYSYRKGMSKLCNCVFACFSEAARQDGLGKEISLYIYYENGDRTECEGDPESLKLCVGYLNYMQQLDDLDPDTVPAGSVLFDDFDSVERTPLTKGLIADCEVYRIADQNTFIASTVKTEDMRDGGI